MELKAFIKIFQKYAKTFFSILCVTVVLALFWQQSQPKTFGATLLLNIGRADLRETTEYTYDDFYRLQADERFADTVVRWLSMPRVVEDIYADAGMSIVTFSARDRKEVFLGKRLSSQVIEVTYSGNEDKVLRSLSNSITRVLNRYAESLNQNGQESGWFVVIGSDPVIHDARVSFQTALLFSIALGVFLGFWGVLLRYYFSE